MKESWVCRDYQRGDERDILTLYKEVNDREMTLEYWRWKFAKNPFNPVIIKLMFDGDKLIGHRGAIPTIVSVQGSTSPAIIMVNTMTHPAYQRAGISTYLAEAIYDQAKQQGIKFAYNFPNLKSYPVYLRINGWQSLDRRSIWQKQIPSQATSSLTHIVAMTRVARFDHRIDRLWDRLKENYVVAVPRTEKYLNWKFTENPITKYPKYIIENNDEISGYLVLKIYTKGSETTGHIIDMLCLNDRELVRSLIAFSQEFFRKMGIKKISCWMPQNCFYTQILEEESFVKHQIETHFGLRVLSELDSRLEKVKHIENWHLTMADSDVY